MAFDFAVGQRVIVIQVSLGDTDCDHPEARGVITRLDPRGSYSGSGELELHIKADDGNPTVEPADWCIPEVACTCRKYNDHTTDCPVSTFSTAAHYR